MRITLLLLLTLHTLTFSAYCSDGVLRLTLDDAIRMAVEKNLDVRAELYNPAQYEAEINRYRSIYEPVLTLESNYTDSSTATFSSAGNAVDSKAIGVNSSITQLLWTGGTAALSFNNGYTDSTNVTGWQTGLGITLNQPLLKNVGREATEININISRSQKFASLERFNSVLLTTVSQVRTEYFKLQSLRDELTVKKLSLELAQKILSETNARVKAGVLPAMETLNADFGAVTREKDLIDAERAVKDQVDVLRLLLQIDDDSVELQTVDVIPHDQIIIEENEAIQKALSRPDIRELKRNIELNELLTKNYHQKTRPDIVFTASTQLTGLDSGYQRNLEKVVTFDYPVWSVGLNLIYPLGSGAADNDYRRSQLKTRQISLQLKSLEEKSANEVKAAIRAVTSGYMQIDVSDRGVRFAEERLKAFSRKNEVGLATTKDVLDVENDLAIARSNQIKAVVGYANALTRYWQVTGELLEREGIRVVEGDADKLYSEIR
ncbi:MAG: TolC family protein [Desulfuromonadaceae bacterium]|nr:TolC family protein [Desulfuromonadaceae bacterium]MDD2855166.1 TolC family protein [Desulfuromonadaceae bacterium]